MPQKKIKILPWKETAAEKARRRRRKEKREAIPGFTVPETVLAMVGMVRWAVEGRLQNAEEEEEEKEQVALCCRSTAMLWKEGEL